jgi:RNA polymerase sigma-70 factor (ECF subfamily)
MNGATLDCDADATPAGKTTHPSLWAVRLRAAIDGDESGYPDLLDDIGRLARKVARNQVARWNYGESIVEDIVQETLIAVHCKRDSWDCARPVEPWAATLARNKAIEAMRRARIGREAKLEDLEEDVVAPPDPAPETRGDVERLLSRLKPRQKDIVTSVMLREEPVAEVARRLSMSEIAVRVAMHRAVKSMGAAVGASATVTQRRDREQGGRFRRRSAGALANLTASA